LTPKGNKRFQLPSSGFQSGAKPDRHRGKNEASTKLQAEKIKKTGFFFVFLLFLITFVQNYK